MKLSNVVLTAFAAAAATVGVAGALAAPPGKVEKIEIGLTPSCDPVMLATLKVKKHENTFLVFRFSSECPTARYVHVCAFRNGAPDVPWRECAGLPTASPAKLGAPFKMPAHSTASPSTAHAICTVAFPAEPTFARRRYNVCVASSPASGDPPKCSPTDCATLPVELALEIEP